MQRSISAQAIYSRTSETVHHHKRSQQWLFSISETGSSIKRANIGQSRIVSPRFLVVTIGHTSVVPSESNGKASSRLRMTTGELNALPRIKRILTKAPVGRSSLVSAIVSQDCDVRAALRNARTHAGTHLIRNLVCGSPGSTPRKSTSGVA